MMFQGFRERERESHPEIIKKGPETLIRKEKKIKKIKYFIIFDAFK